MHIDLIATEAWEDLGDELKKTFSGALYLSDANVQLRSYKGAGHAAFEASQALNLIFSHKRSVAYVKGLSPTFEFLIPQYLKEALQVQSQPWDNLKDPRAWCESLKKDTNFVLMAEDHPVTGEVFETENLDKILNEKKIFSIRVSHARHFQVCEEVRPASARILSYGQDLAVSVLGSRFKAQSFTAAQMGWDKTQVIHKIQRKRKRIFDQNLVETFENSFPDWKYFQSHSEAKRCRLYDRAVLVFPDINGEALVKELSQAMSLSANSIEDMLATTSQCAWHDPVSFKGWWQPAPTSEQIRGLVVFSAEILTRKDFANLVKTSYDKVVGLQESFL